MTVARGQGRDQGGHDEQGQDDAIHRSLLSADLADGSRTAAPDPSRHVVIVRGARRRFVQEIARDGDRWRFKSTSRARELAVQRDKAAQGIRRRGPRSSLGQKVEVIPLGEVPSSSGESRFHADAMRCS
jgi:hypothetical protein